MPDTSPTSLDGADLDYWHTWRQSLGLTMDPDVLRQVARDAIELVLALDGALRSRASIGPDDIVVNREAYEALVAVAVYVSSGRRYVDVTPYPDATARRALGALRAALSQPHPEETPKVYPSGTRRPGVYLSPDPAPQPHPKETP